MDSPLPEIPEVVQINTQLKRCNGSASAHSMNSLSRENTLPSIKAQEDSPAIQRESSIVELPPINNQESTNHDKRVGSRTKPSDRSHSIVFSPKRPPHSDTRRPRTVHDNSDNSESVRSTPHFHPLKIGSLTVHPNEASSTNYKSPEVASTNYIQSPGVIHQEEEEGSPEAEAVSMNYILTEPSIDSRIPESIIRSFSTQTIQKVETFSSRLLIILEDEECGVDVKKFLTLLTRAGINVYKDPRLSEMMSKLSRVKEASAFTSPELNIRRSVSKEEFLDATLSCAKLLNDAISSDLVIPDFEGFCGEIKDIYQELLKVKDDDSAFLGISICTVDGQRYSLGDSEKSYCIQTCSKTLTYAICVQELGSKEVHKHVGREQPLGNFHDMSLDKNGLPFNPLQDGGAIACCSILKPHLSLDLRFEYTYEQYRKLSGYEYVGFNNATCLKEKSIADHNVSIAYLLKESGVFPPGASVKETLDFYYQLRSIKTTSKASSLIAGTLANGGVCPTTKEACLSEEAVRNTLAVMFSSGWGGMSGEWAGRVGLPSMASSSGAILLVVPGVLGACVWSPQPDKARVSLRGVKFGELLAEKFNFHQFDGIYSDPTHGKLDPRRNPLVESRESLIINMMCAASSSDQVLLQRYLEMGVDLNMTDYDGRTALHLAVCQGNMLVVRFLVKVARCHVNLEDRWGRTPLDDSIKHKQKEVTWYLKSKGGASGGAISETAEDDESR